MTIIHSKDTKVFVAEFEVTSHSFGLDLDANRNMPEETAFGDTGRKHNPGPSQDTYTLESLLDDGSDGDAALHGNLGTAKTVTLLPKGDVRGASGFAGSGALGSHYALRSVVGEVVKSRLDVSFEQVADRVKSLIAKVTKTATYAEGSIDDAASSSAGGVWVYHITAFSATGGNAKWKIQLQDSSNDASWANVGSEEVTLSAVGAARRAFTGTFRRYVRVRMELDASSGSITFQASYERL